jgi:cytochrome b subunit of formate dehydrogenase
MAAIIVVSGFAIYKPTQLHPLPLLFGGYQGARLVHFWMTIGLGLFFVVHVLQVLRSGWGNFRSMITGYVIERRPSADSVAGVPPSGTDDTEIVGYDRTEVSR